MAKFVPDNVILYVEQRGGKSALESFRNSALGKQIDKINFTETGKKIGASQNVTEVIDKLCLYALANHRYVSP